MSFAEYFSSLVADRGFKSDEQLAKRAMSLQRPGGKRVNVQARTINNWRNGRSLPRSLTEGQFGLVVSALKLSQDEQERLHECFQKAANKERQPEPVFAPRNAALRIRASILVAVLLMGAIVAILLVGQIFTIDEKTQYLTEIPPEQLRLTSDGFVLPHSDEVVLSDADLKSLTGWELYVARNEIFARHGRPFVKEWSGCLQGHFDSWAKKDNSSSGWYEKRSGDPIASDLEYQNALTIRNYECRVRGGQFNCSGLLKPCLDEPDNRLE
jgi:hypothetical protein